MDYAKREEIVEAIQYTGNIEEIKQFAGADGAYEFCGQEAAAIKGIVLSIPDQMNVAVYPRGYVVKDGSFIYSMKQDEFERNYIQVSVIGEV